MPKTLPIGALLKQLRRASGLTQEALADRAGYSASYISQLERGERFPLPATLESLAQVLHITDESHKALLAALQGQRREASAPNGPPANGETLPTVLTTMVGRQQHEARLLELLLQSHARLVTLIGPPGVGKTRLAQHLLPLCQSAFADGIFFVSLADITEPPLIFSLLAQRLGINDSGSEAQLDVVMRVLREKQVMLVLDNFEHLLPGALSLVALLETCHQVTVLVTSRVPLRVRGEQVYPVPPLDLPSPTASLQLATVAQIEAVALFVQRAQEVNPNFQLTEENVTAVGEICRRVDGLPLAIELAAAQSHVFSSSALLTRLNSAHYFATLSHGARDLPARQQTLMYALDWSYNLLTPQEQEMLRTLSVCRGGWSLVAAQTLAVTVPDVFVVLLALIEANLVTVAEQGEDLRFDMLFVIREYGLAQLLAHDEVVPTRSRHAHYYAALAEQAQPFLIGPEQQEYLRALDKDIANMRDTLHWCVAQQEGEVGLRLAVALWRYWQVRGNAKEGLGWLEQLLAFGTSASWLLRVRATHAAGELAFRLDLYEQAGRRAEQALQWFRELGDQNGEADALTLAANVAAGQGNNERARMYDEASLTFSRKRGDKRGMARSLNNLGFDAQQRGKYPQAAVSYAEASTLLREVGDTATLIIALANWGDALCLMGDYEQARIRCEEALSLSRAMDSLFGIGIALVNLGDIAFRAGDMVQAERYFLECFVVREQTGDALGIALLYANLGNVALAQGDFGKAHTLLVNAYERFRVLQSPLYLARTSTTLGEVHRQQGNLLGALACYDESCKLLHTLENETEMIEPTEGVALIAHSLGFDMQASLLMSSASHARQTFHSPPIGPYARQGPSLIQALRANLGEDHFAQLWEAGQQTPLEASVINELLIQLMSHVQAGIIVDITTSPG